MICRECGNEARELYTCRICDGSGLCAECALLCEDDLPFTEWVESAENEPASETLRKLDGLEWLDRALTDDTEDEQC
jgi:hypothetical protein